MVSGPSFNDSSHIHRLPSTHQVPQGKPGGATPPVSKPVTPPPEKNPTVHRGQDGHDVKQVNKEVELKGQVTFDQVGSAQKVSKTEGIKAPQLETENPRKLEASAALSQEGVDAYRAEDFDVAKDFFEASFELSPNATTAYNMGCCYQELGQMEEAQKLFDTATEMDPRSLNLGLKIQERLERFTLP